MLDAFTPYFRHVLNPEGENGDFDTTALGPLIAAMRNALLVGQTASVDSEQR